MEILITNDDGISSKLILLLFNKLTKLGHNVIVCAPDKNNSCISQAIRYWEYEDNHLTKVSEFMYSHPGTPADGINYYLKEFNKLPDLVISGINNGLNAGVDVQYSGTIGAASEAINMNIPAIAISSEVDYDEEVVNKGLDIIFDKVFKHQLYSKDFIYSFNIPHVINYDKIVVAPLNSGIDIDEPKYEFLSKFNHIDKQYYHNNIGKNTDLYFLYKGIITVTPIVVDRTDYKNMSKIANFFDK